jgi:general secretion pathway protein C
MASRWLAFVVWALAAFTAVAWLLQVTAGSRPVPSHAVAVDTTASLRSDWSKLLGAAAPAAEAVVAVPKPDSRFKLLGVVSAPSLSATPLSVALIAVGDKPARAFRVGAAVDGDTYLLAVRARAVDLGPRDGPFSVTLELPALAAAATGTLSPGASPAAPPMPTAPPPESQPPAGAEPAQGQPLTPQPIPGAPGSPPPSGG